MNVAGAAAAAAGTASASRIPRVLATFLCMLRAQINFPIDTEGDLVTPPVLDAPLPPAAALNLSPICVQRANILCSAALASGAPLWLIKFY